MDSAVGWTLGSGWSIGSGVALGVPDAATTSLTHVLSLIAGTYLLTFEVKTRTAGSVTPRLSGGVGGLIIGTNRAAVGVFQETLVTSGSLAVGFNKNPTFNGSIDNFSVVRIAP